MRKVFLIIMTVAAACTVLTSCQGDARYNKEQEHDINLGIYNNDDIIDEGAVRGGTLRLFSTMPDTLNPILTKNIFVQDFSKLVFESLVKLEKNQKPSPVLSDSWSVSSDGLVWTFHIRENVKWHDGKSVSAEDVEFTVREIMNGGNNSVYKSNLQGIESYGAVDRNNFRIVIGKPNSFQAELMTFPIIPKHYFQGDNMKGQLSGTLPPGTGPYCFKSIEENRAIHLSSNENWWKGLSKGEDSLKLPYIENVDIKIYKKPEDALNAFQTRDVDIVCVDSADYEGYRGRVDLALKTFPSKDFEFIAFNLNNKVLSEQAVRQAIAYSIDKEKLVRTVFPGRGVASEMSIVPGSWLYDTNMNYYDANRSKAGEILTENGWVEEKGRLTKRINGRREYLSFELLVNEENQLRQSAANEIAQQLKTIGIEVTVVPLKWEEIFNRIDSGKHDMVLIGCTIPSIPDVSFLYGSSYFSPVSADGYIAARNISGYSNPNVENYIEKIFKEVDNDRKRALFINMAEIIAEDVPYIGLCFLNNAVLYNRDIRGKVDSHVWDRFSEITEWYITKR